MSRRLPPLQRGRMPKVTGAPSRKTPVRRGAPGKRLGTLDREALLQTAEDALGDVPLDAGYISPRD